MQKKLYLSTMLFGKSELIILDEPFNGLDFDSINLFKNMIKEYHEKNNCTIIVSSHHLKDLSDFCNTICLLENGRLIEYSSIENIKDNVIINSPNITILEGFLQKNGIEINFIDKCSLSIGLKSSVFDLAKMLVENNIIFEEIYFDNPLKRGMKKNSDRK